jgi:hypothetical protein
MANRQFQQFQFTLEKFVVTLFGKATIGAAGAPTLSQVNSKGIKGIVRNSAGDYTITLQDSYYKLLDVKAVVQNASGIPASGVVGIKANAVTTAPNGTLEVVFSNGGAATDPASGDTIYFIVRLSNSGAL